MSRIFSLKVVKNGQTVARKMLVAGKKEATGPLLLNAEADMAYVFATELGDKPLTKLRTQRVGQDLHVALEGDTLALPSLVIQGYFNFEASSVLATTSASGSLVVFAPESSWLPSTRNTVVQSAAEAEPSVWSYPGVQLGLLGLGGLALAAGGGGSSDSSTSETATTTLTNYGSASNTALTTTPQASDYSKAGVTGVSTSNVDAMNSAINRMRASTLAEVKTVVAAYLKVLNEANGTAADATPGDDPALADYQALGIKLLGAEVDSSAGRTQLGLLNDMVKGRTLTDVNTVTKLDNLAAIADKLMLNAKGNTPGTQLTATDFNNIGLADVSSSNVAAVLSAIAASADEGTQVATVEGIKSMVSAYIKLLAMADGTKANTTDSTKLMSLAEYQTLSVSAGIATTTGHAQQASALKLFNEVVDGLSNSAVDTVTELNDLGKAVDKVMKVSVAADSASSAGLGLAVSDLSLLGLNGMTVDNLASVTEAIRLTQSSDGTALDTLKELQGAVDLGVIMNYADTALGTSAHVAPTYLQYQSAGLPTSDSASHKGISASNVAAVNSAVDALSSTEVNTVAKIQTVIDAYGKLLTMADGTKANTTDSTKLATLLDYQALGALSGFDLSSGTPGSGSTTALATGGGPLASAALSLLNTVVDGRSSTHIDTVTEINQLSVASDKLLNWATGHTPSSSLTLSDFSLLGLSSVTAGNLSEVTQTLQNVGASDATLVDTLAELQALVSLGVVRAYAHDASAGTPSLQDYKDLNLDASLSWNSTLQSAVNTVVDSMTETDITSQTTLETVALAYQAVINEVGDLSSGNTNPTAANYEAVLRHTGHEFHGAPTTADSTLLSSNALALMNDIMRHASSTSSVDAKTELEKIATVVDKVMVLAQSTLHTDVPNLTFADMDLLNLNHGSMYDGAYSNKLLKINELIAATADDGSAANSWQTLQNIINSQAVISA